MKDRSLIKEFFSKNPNCYQYTYLLEFPNEDLPKFKTPDLLNLVCCFEDLTSEDLFVEKIIGNPDQCVGIEIRDKYFDRIYQMFSSIGDDGAYYTTICRISCLGCFEDSLYYGDNLNPEDCGALENNQRVLEGMLYESEYILQCRESIWYSYVDRNMGRGLFVNALLKEFNVENDQDK